ncbi:unnamed protein product [Acanthoscelides obtectus]|uniref:Uncharacterized protein n=1 Tax=Acanthoscelides obtectus TaxID=200917 RepID=A0A9P0KGG6_ACAOB|nr:unnamed protein product [Acanthoscelides obtectus]CAK1631782.1 hypothetical protein AOBTE_LOCUS7155 [Acanthoscelides obtectus]
MSWVAMVLGVSVVLWGRHGDSLGWGCKAEVAGKKDELDMTTIDVHQLAAHAHGTELVLLENRYRDQPGYRFEDFFWTGSGEEPDENPWSIDKTEIIYETKTVVSTVFIESPQSSHNEPSRNTSQCVHNCDAPGVPDDQISPSPTISSPTPMVPEEEDGFAADRQFWLITVLKTDGRDPAILDLKTSLEKLYRKAFERQHERHLGIGYRLKRYSKEQPVNVYIHKVDKSALDGEQKVEVLYHVSVSGKPVPAITAANDMNFVTDEEVQEVLGYPFLVKAEPYLKPAEPQGLSSAKNTWMFIGISILAFLIMLLIIAFVTLGCTKRKRVASPAGMATQNKQQAFAKEAGVENKAFVSEPGKAESPTYIRFKNENSTLTKSAGESRAHSSVSSTSSSSTSLDISPLMHLKKKIPFKKSYRPKAAINKTVPATLSIGSRPAEIFDSDSSSSRRDSPDTIFLAGNYDPGVVSPKSYLSMPSIKSFPKGNMPEPLNRVLEPVSVLHLDIPEGEAAYGDKTYRSEVRLVRHGSAGAVEDPGVIGPIVWNMHCQRLQHGKYQSVTVSVS